LYVDIENATAIKVSLPLWPVRLWSDLPQMSEKLMIWWKSKRMIGVTTAKKVLDIGTVIVLYLKLQLLMQCITLALRSVTFCQRNSPSEKPIVRISNNFLRQLIKLKVTAIMWKDKKWLFISRKRLANCCKRVFF
jgi:hypothetical protein